MTNIDILKSLTQTTFDSVEGYRKAIDTAESTALKNALRRRMDQRVVTLNTLNDELTSRGEDQIVTLSATGTGHQLYMKFINAFSDGDKNAVSRIEEGEDFLAERFSNALESGNELDLKLRTVITDAFAEIRSAEKFSDLLEEQYA